MTRRRHVRSRTAPGGGSLARRADLRGGAGRDPGDAGDGGLCSPRGGPGAPGPGGHGAHADARCRHRLADVAQARQRTRRRDGRRCLAGPAPVQAVDGELAPSAGARCAARSHRAGRAAARRGLRPGHAGTARLPDRYRAGRAHRAARFRSRHASLRRRHRGARARAGRDRAGRAAAHMAWVARFVDDRLAVVVPARLADAPDPAALRRRRAGARRRAPRRASDCTRSSATPPTSSP